jgi:hypothetical protein
LLPGLSAIAIVRSSITCTSCPGGSPFGEASQLPSASEVAITQNGDAASQSRSTSSNAARPLLAARSCGVPRSPTSSSTESIVVHVSAVLTPSG